LTKYIQSIAKNWKSMTSKISCQCTFKGSVSQGRADAALITNVADSKQFLFGLGSKYVITDPCTTFQVVSDPDPLPFQI